MHGARCRCAVRATSQPARNRWQFASRPSGSSNRRRASAGSISEQKSSCTCEGIAGDLVGFVRSNAEALGVEILDTSAYDFLPMHPRFVVRTARSLGAGGDEDDRSAGVGDPGGVRQSLLSLVDIDIFGMPSGEEIIKPYFCRHATWQTCRDSAPARTTRHGSPARAETICLFWLSTAFSAR